MSVRSQGNDPVDVRGLLDPELREVFGSFELPPFDAETVSAIRNTPFPGMALSDAVARTEHVVPGDPPIPVRVHRPAGVDGVLPGIFTIHGGGYVIGSYDMDDFLHDQWSPSLGTVGISVQYRLAPDTPYPGPIEDCYAALRWAHEHADEIGVDPARLGIYGISAGGGLAAALALMVRDRGEFPMAFQLLDCPMLDDRQVTPSIGAAGLYIWGAESNTFGWRSYLGDLYGSDDVPPHAAAARATNLAGLPPSCVVVGSIDGFRDEDVDYASRLNQAGVPCELHVIAGLPHAYQMAQDAQAVELATRCKDDWLARQLKQLGED
ncbi:MAG TPA: alpha/beta hydrolase [Acidimicrobiales bacterium]|jgi:acetyl esterase/lipase|nr:alpha/beta hydrolase [Acidimicrobiales bacterium]